MLVAWYVLFFTILSSHAHVTVIATFVVVGFKFKSNFNTDNWSK